MTIHFCFRLVDVGLTPGDTFCVLPANPLPGHPISMDSSNLIGSRLATLRGLHSKGITKLQIPSKKVQLEAIAKGNIDDQKILDSSDVIDSESQ